MRGDSMQSTADNDRISHPPTPEWRGPEVVVLCVAYYLYCAAFVGIGITLTVVGVAGINGAGPEASVVGIAWILLLGLLGRTLFRTAGRLEFASRLLRVRRVLPGLSMTPPRRVEKILWPVSALRRSVGITLDDGSTILVPPTPGLRAYIAAVSEADPSIQTQFSTTRRDQRRWRNSERAYWLSARIEALGSRHRALRIVFCLVAVAFMFSPFVMVLTLP